MKKRTPKTRLSKAKQRELNARRRGSWNGVNPVTKVVESKKAYSRARIKDDLLKRNP